MPTPRRSRFSAAGDKSFRIQTFDKPPARDQEPEEAPAVEPEEEAGTVAGTTAEPEVEEAGQESALLEREGVPFQEATPRQRVRPLLKRQLSVRLGLLLAVAGLTLGVGAGYLLPRPAVIGEAPVTNNRAEDVKPLTDAEESELDAVFAARHAGKFVEADQQFSALAQQHPNWPAMNLEVGRTRLYERNLAGAGAVLKPAAAEGAMPAEANAILGAVYKVEKSYDLAEACYARAVALNPAEPIYYFYWAECLREQGKLQQATAKYRSALLRNQYETATPLFRVKLWLTEIEADQEKHDGTNKEIDAELAQTYPPMEGLLAGAARDLKASNPAAATAKILQARRATDPAVFLIVMRDPVFQTVITRPELAGIFQTIPPASVASTPSAAETTDGAPK